MPRAKGNVAHKVRRYIDACVASEPTWQASCHATEDTLFVASEVTSDVERVSSGATP